MDEDWACDFGDSLAHVNPERCIWAPLKPGALSTWEAPVLLLLLLLLTNGQDRVFPAHLLEPAARALIPNIVQVEHLVLHPFSFSGQQARHPTYRKALEIFQCHAAGAKRVAVSRAPTCSPDQHDARSCLSHHDER